MNPRVFLALLFPALPLFAQHHEGSIVTPHGNEMRISQPDGVYTATRR